MIKIFKMVCEKFFFEFHLFGYVFGISFADFLDLDFHIM